MRTARTLVRVSLVLLLLTSLSACVQIRDSKKPPDADRVRELVRAYSETPLPKSEPSDATTKPFPWIPTLAIFALVAIAAAILGGSPSIGPAGRRFPPHPEPDREAPPPKESPSEDAARSLAANGRFGPACVELYRICAERAANGLDAEEGRALTRSEIEARIPPLGRGPFSILGATTERFLFGDEFLGPSDWEAAFAAYRGIAWDGPDA